MGKKEQKEEKGEVIEINEVEKNTEETKNEGIEMKNRNGLWYCNKRIKLRKNIENKILNMLYYVRKG